MSKAHILRPMPIWRPDPERRAWCGAKKLETLVEYGNYADPDRWRPPEGVCSNCWSGAGVHAHRTRWPLMAARSAASYSDGSRDQLERETAAMAALAWAHWDEYVAMLDREPETWRLFVA